MSEPRVFKHEGRDRAWYVADSPNGTIIVDNCTSLDAAIQARQSLLEGWRSELRREHDYDSD